MKLTAGRVQRLITGKTITDVTVRRRTDASGRSPAHDVERIELSDGSRLVFLVVETEHGDGYITEALYLPPPRNRHR